MAIARCLLLDDKHMMFDHFFPKKCYILVFIVETLDDETLQMASVSS